MHPYVSICIHMYPYVSICLHVYRFSNSIESPQSIDVNLLDTSIDFHCLDRQGSSADKTWERLGTAWSRAAQIRFIGWNCNQ